MWGDDGAGDAAGEAEAGLGVDDVRVADAVEFDELMEITGGGDGAVGEGNDGGRGIVWFGEEGDGPS